MSTEGKDDLDLVCTIDRCHLVGDLVRILLSTTRRRGKVVLRVRPRFASAACDDDTVGTILLDVATVLSVRFRRERNCEPSNHVDLVRRPLAEVRMEYGGVIARMVGLFANAGG